MSRWMQLLVGVVLASTTACSVIEPEQRTSLGSPSRSAPPSSPATTLRTVANAGHEMTSLWPADAPAIHAKSAILIDAESGEVIYQKNADEHRQVASTQKLLTALLVAEHGDLDGTMVIKAADCNVEPTRLGFRPGQRYVRRDLLNAMLVKSCNDVAAALGRDYAGSIPAFADVMNAKARSIGATSSHFVNPNGLPAAQYSTARDMSRIAFRAWRNPVIRGMVRMPYYRFTFSDGHTKLLESTDKLLGRVPWVDGMKTGYTFAAGRCLITSATLGGHSYILVQLGSKTTYIFNDAEQMIEWAASRRSGSLFANR